MQLNDDQQRTCTRIIEFIGEEFWSSDLTPEQAREVIDHLRWLLTVPSTLDKVLPDKPEPPLNEQTHPALTAGERNKNIKGVPT